MNNNKNYFKIPVEWRSFGVVNVEADTLEEAIEKFDATINDISLPEADYIDDSFIRCKASDESVLKEDIDYYKTFN